jgi:hypothetical protein
MVARSIPTGTPFTLTRENHPENISEPQEKPATVKLGHTVFIGALCGVLGMTIGTAALSTALQSDNRWETIFLIPLVATTVSLLGGWVGAFFYMIRSDASQKES